MLLTTIIIFILVLGLLVFVHELGHFITAKRAGIKVEEFGFGLPPRMFGVKKGETIYSLNWLPIGGFVKIYGEDGEGAKDPRSFSGRPIWQRAIVLVAGVLMNFLLAMFLFTLVFKIGVPAAVDEEVMNARDIKIQVTQVASNSPAQKAGLLMGDSISEVIDASGAKKEISEIQELLNFIQARKNQEITLKVNRGKETIFVKLLVRENPPVGEGSMGVALVKTGIVSFGWREAIKRGIIYSFQIIYLVVASFFGILFNLFRGISPGVEVAGPVMIYQLTGQMSQLGINYLLQFVAFLSINLAFINILPFPALDGGRLFFLLIEKIKGSPVNPIFERKANSVGLALLILLIAVITIKDVSRLF